MGTGRPRDTIQAPPRRLLPLSVGIRVRDVPTSRVIVPPPAGSYDCGCDEASRRSRTSIHHMPLAMPATTMAAATMATTVVAAGVAVVAAAGMPTAMAGVVTDLAKIG